MKDDGWILITGCSSGIGRACAIELHKRGLNVIASARDSNDVSGLRSMGLAVVGIEQEDLGSIREGFAEAVRIAGEGGIRFLFANAGYGQSGALEDVSSEGMRQQLNTNVVGTHALIKAAIPEMRKRGGGRIVINSSVLGVVGMRLRGAYVCSKFALEGLADVLRLELARDNITVSLIEPGPVLTRFRANSYKAFLRHTATEGSVHQAAYARLTKKLTTEGPVAPFTLPAESCVQPLLHAITARRPRARYRVTIQTKVFATLKWLLPTRIMDAIATRG